MSQDLSIPSTHKGCIYDSPGRISTRVVEDLPTPPPGPGQLLIRLTHSGVCHSDLAVMLSNWATLPEPTPKDQVGGHEGVGYIVQKGPETDDSALQIGQRVGIKWISGVCGKCAACSSGIDNLCPNQAISGYFVPGTFQQYVLSPANYVTPIPDGLDSAAAAPMLCAGVTVYAALTKANVKAGEWIVLLGAGGGLGHIATQIASRGLGMRVIGIDHPSKEELVLKSGAEHFVDYTTVKDVEAHIKSLTEGLGAHAAIVLTASNAAYASALPMLRFRGTLVCVGVPEGKMQPIANAFPGMLLETEQRIVGSSVGSLEEAKATLELARKGVVKTHYRLCKMQDLTDVFHEMEQGKIQGRVVMDLQ